MNETKITPWNEHEQLLDLEQLRALVPKRRGEPVTRRTIRDWCFAGCRGQRLPHVRIGRQIYSSRERLAQWIADLSATETVST